MDSTQLSRKSNIDMYRSRLVLLTLCVAVSLPAVATPFDPEMNKNMPVDVARYLDRAGTCWHFGGEEGYDAARAKEIDRQVRMLKCNRLARDEAALRQKHGDDAAIIARLDKAKAMYQ